MKERYDLKAAPAQYQIGQRIWISTHKTRKGLSKKLLHHWHGPYRIVKQPSPVNFKLRNSANRLVAAPVHVNRMKLYYDAKDRPIEPPAVLTDNDDFSLTEDELPVDSFAPEIPRAEEPLDPVDETSTVTKSNQHIYR